MNYSLIVLQQVELNNRITFIYHLLFTNELSLNKKIEKKKTFSELGVEIYCPTKPFR